MSGIPPVASTSSLGLRPLSPSPEASDQDGPRRSSSSSGRARGEGDGDGGPSRMEVDGEEGVGDSGRENNVGLAEGTSGMDYYVDSEEDDDPDDPIVRTLPVFLTPALASSLALLQYPHRPPAFHTHHPLLPPSLRPENNSNNEEWESSAERRGARVTARYKPKVGQLELSVPLEVREGLKEQRFNEERAKLLGRGIQDTDLGLEGSGRPKQSNNSGAGASGSGQGGGMLAYEEGNDTPLERMTLQGETVPDQTWYTCAVLRDNELHLTPMTRTLQMRAHLSYLDRINNLERQNARRERQAKEGGSDEEGGSDGGEEDEEGSKSAQAIAARKAKKAAAADKKRQNDEVKNINVSVKSSGAGGDDAGAGGARGAGGDVKTGRAAASLFGPMKAAAEEDWVDLPFHDPMSEGANRVYEQLFASNQANLKMLTKATQYLRL